MTETTFVLGVDAADYALCREWDCRNLLLAEHRQLETFAHSIDVPATLEVWPTIATGLHPDDHGVVLDPASRTSYSPTRRVVHAVHQQLPAVVRRWTQRLKTSTVGESMPTTEAATVFEAGAVHNWPGVTPANTWQDSGDEFGAVVDGNLNEAEFYRRELARAGSVVGWLGAHTETAVPIAGAHLHLLDHAGHLYAENPTELERAYRDLDDLVGWLRDRVDHLVVVSDHGMQTTTLSDDRPGVHSERALVSSTIDDDLPASVFDVRDWLEDRIREPTPRDESPESTIPREHLEELGYL